MQYRPIYLGPMNRPGDEMYEKETMFPSLYFERETLAFLAEKETEYDTKHSKEKIKERGDFLRAFTIANKADSVTLFGKLSEAEKMCFHSIKINPCAFDAYRILTTSFFKIVDHDTILCGLREQLAVMRHYLKPYFDQHAGNFYECAETCPYIRVLDSIIIFARQSMQLDLEIYTLEEIIRLNHNDYFHARDPLLACYLQLLAHQYHGIEVHPKRTIEEIEQFMYQGFGYEQCDSLFDGSSSDYMFRLAQVIIAYYRKDEKWKEMAKNLEKDSKILFKCLFGENYTCASVISDKLLLPSADESPEINVDRLQAFYKEIAFEWGDFITDAKELLRTGKQDKGVLYRTYDDDPISEKNLINRRNAGETNLNLARDALKRRAFKQAIDCCSVAKSEYTDAACNPKRWYTDPDIPFAVVTNRATASAQLSMWELTRIDARFSLAMKPDHIRTYERLPNIAAGFFNPIIKRELDQLLIEVKYNKERTEDDWKSLAKRAVSLISLDSLILSKTELYTTKLKKEILERGINDMFTTVNYPDYPPLPWVHQDFYEEEF